MQLSFKILPHPHLSSFFLSFFAVNTSVLFFFFNQATVKNIRVESKINNALCSPPSSQTQELSNLVQGDFGPLIISISPSRPYFDNDTFCCLNLCKVPSKHNFQLGLLLTVSNVYTHFLFIVFTNIRLSLCGYIWDHGIHIGLFYHCSSWSSFHVKVCKPISYFS